MSSIDDAKKHIEQMRYEMRNVLWQCFLFLAKKDVALAKQLIIKITGDKPSSTWTGEDTLKMCQYLQEHGIDMHRGASEILASLH